MASHMGMYTPARVEQEYRWVVTLTLPVFLVVAAVTRLTRSPRGPAASRRSVFQEAYATAHTVIPYCFEH